jgi:hypothetical protein
MCEGASATTWDTYVGSFIFPFRDFSFVLKVQCEERGITGVREAVIVDEKLASGELQIDPDGKFMTGWMKDPNDATRASGLARSLADDEEYDQRFADHPLSRARRFLRTAEANILVSDAVRTASPFIYRRPIPRKMPWWKLW